MPIVLAPLDQDLKVVKILADEKTKKHLENFKMLGGCGGRI